MTPPVDPRLTDWRKICACCGYRTIPDKGECYSYGRSDNNYCPVCHWGDDDQVLDDDYVPTNDGPNSGISLRQARMNFLAHGAAHLPPSPDLRKPLPEEIPPDWLPPDLTPKFTESERLAAALVPTKWISET